MSEASALSAQLNEELIVAGYRLFFGRVPESRDAIQSALSYGTVAAFREALLSSDEFRTIAERSAQDAEVPPKPLSLTLPAIEVEWNGEPAGADALLAHVKETWTRLGTERPHWSVLSSDQFKPERIAAHEVEFYASGATDTEELLATIRRNGLATERMHRVFEFGCGVGRVTPHLANAFPRVTACDVSPSHLQLAQRLAKQAGVTNVDFDLVDSTEFGMFGPFDVWFSRIVLQHNPPPIIAQILRRALTLLAPGGVAVFQVPTYAVGYRFRVAEYVRTLPAGGHIEMHVLPQPAVFQIAREAGCWPLEVREDTSAGLQGWISNTFVFSK